jgi:hypothetical protein
MALRAVQALDMRSWDEFHRCCPESVKSLMDYPIPALFANWGENSLQKLFMDAKNKKFFNEEANESAEYHEEESRHPEEGTHDVEKKVVLYFTKRLSEVKKLDGEAARNGMDTDNDNADDKQDEQEDSTRKLTDVASQLEQAIRDAHLHNGVDDTFQHKVEQAKLLLRLQTLHENRKIQANLLVGRYTLVMKSKLQHIIDLAEQVARNEDGENFEEGLQRLFGTT